MSIQKSIPISLLIMSRAFNIAAVDAEPTGKRPRLDKQPPDTSMESLTSSMSSMDPDIINEVKGPISIFSKYFFFYFESFLGGDRHRLSCGREHGGLQEEEARVPGVPTRCNRRFLLIHILNLIIISALACTYLDDRGGEGGGGGCEEE